MAAEKEMQRLRKLPENKICPNCSKTDPMGFASVCIQFRTFICSNCKSSHQAFSHRCKSVMMSNWNMDEARLLDARNGGGNQACLDTLLANVPESLKPRPDGDINELKRFIDRAYNGREWEASPEQTQQRQRRDAASEKEKLRDALVAPGPRSYAAAPAPPAPTPARSAPAASVDLLGDGPSDVAAAPPAASAPALDLFGEFSAPPAPASSSTAAPAANQSAFSFMSSDLAPASTPAPAAEGSAFSFMSSPESSTGAFSGAAFQSAGQQPPALSPSQLLQQQLQAQTQQAPQVAALPKASGPNFAALGGGFGGPAGAAGGAMGSNMCAMGAQSNQFGGMNMGSGMGGGMGGMGGGFGAPPAADARPPEERFASQIEQLNNMGFSDKPSNLQALQMANGDVNQAINFLLGGN